MSKDKVLQIRLNPDEYGRLKKLADGLYLPTSTLARALLLDALAYEAKLLAERDDR